eukprot:m.201274 g.201274  ORF g.201274 m.201274 type:complete len:662 (+) comp15501_c0_seq7:1949-3934(+)
MKKYIFDPGPSSIPRGDPSGKESIGSFQTSINQRNRNMKLIILVSGPKTRLEREIDADAASVGLAGVPKALLPGNNGPLLNSWLRARENVAFSDVYLVTNAEKYKYFERWATAHGLPRDIVINDGSTAASGAIGAVADLHLVLTRCKIKEDVMVVSGDMLFNPESFDASTVVRFFELTRGDVACYYTLRGGDRNARGLLELDPASQRITAFFEKPAADKTTSTNAGIVFYCFRAATLPLIAEYLSSTATRAPAPARPALGHLLEWLVGRTAVYGMKLSEPFDLIGDVGLAEYRACLAAPPQTVAKEAPLTRRVNARVGLLGNPSDGFNGKTVSLSIRNYWAEVTIAPHKHVVLVRHPLNDPTEYGSLADLHGVSTREGYQGGLRLMQATCKKFFEYCVQHGIALASRGFSLQYDTNIPRQVGLAGSSAIVTATLECLKRFFNIDAADLPIYIQPNLALSVETEELGINAGLQDRVVQAYGGLVSMDFSEALLSGRGYGEYERIDPAVAPPLWLAYCAHPKDSGKMHNTVRQRWLAGDAEARSAMQEFASFAEKGSQLLKAAASGGHDAKAKAALVAGLADLMDANFALRRKLYSDACLGSANLEMAAIARRHNAAAKLPGSGGAVLGLCRDQATFPALKAEMEENGYVCVELLPGPEVDQL